MTTIVSDLGKLLDQLPAHCPAPSRQPHGHHKDYINMGKGKLYCRACGATAYLPGFEPPEDQPDHRTRPTLEEVYEVVGGSYVVSIE